MSVVLKNIPGDRGTTESVKSGFFVGTNIAIATPQRYATTGIDGASLVSASPAVVGVSSNNPIRAFADRFYFRIWVVPLVLDAQNPIAGDPIPFYIWNAYLTDNEVDLISSVNATGLSLDFDDTAVWSALEYREVNITIGTDAPYQIDASFTFDFEYGGSSMRFLALLADIVPQLPDSIITETYEWLTDEIRSYNGSEQRIAVRPRPRRSITLDISLLDDADRKRLYDKIYKTIASTVIAPSYQFQAPLKQATVIADNRFYCNTKRADLRAGENVVIVTPSGQFYLYKIADVYADYATITTAFAAALPKNSIVAAGFQARIPNNTAISMMSISGKSSLKLDIVDARDQIAQPATVVTLDVFDSFPVLNRHPLADSEAQEAFDMGLEVIDNEIAAPAVYSNWTQPYINGSRRFLIQSMLDITDSEWWRVFLDYCNGKQKAFLLSTKRHDLVKVESSEPLISQIEVEGTDYANLFFESNTYKRLEIETNQGTFWVKGTNVTNNGASTTIEFSPSIAIDPATLEIIRISYLMLARLGSDTVTFTHNGTHSIVEFPIRAALE